MNTKTQEKILNIVKTNYTQIASEFSQTRQKKIWPELINLTKQVKDKNSVLDVGCGNGRLLSTFGEKKINYLGIDTSEELIKIAQKNYPNNKFKVGNILELDKIEDSSFDYVYAIAVLHHIPGEDLQIKAVKQLKNKLKPGGEIIITVWNLWTQKKYLKLILKFAWRKLIGKNKMDFGDILFSWKDSFGQFKSKRYYHAFSTRELKKITKLAGLKVKKIYRDKYNFYLIVG